MSLARSEPYRLSRSAPRNGPSLKLFSPGKGQAGGDVRTANVEGGTRILAVVRGGQANPERRRDFHPTLRLGDRLLQAVPTTRWPFGSRRKR